MSVVSDPPTLASRIVARIVRRPRVAALVLIAGCPVALAASFGIVAGLVRYAGPLGIGSDDLRAFAIVLLGVSFVAELALGRRVRDGWRLVANAMLSTVANLLALALVSLVALMTLPSTAFVAFAVSGDTGSLAVRAIAALLSYTFLLAAIGAAVMVIDAWRSVRRRIHTGRVERRDARPGPVRSLTPALVVAVAVLFLALMQMHTFRAGSGSCSSPEFGYALCEDMENAGRRSSVVVTDFDDGETFTLGVPDRITVNLQRPHEALDISECDFLQRFVYKTVGDDPFPYVFDVLRPGSCEVRVEDFAVMIVARAPA